MAWLRLGADLMRMGTSAVGRRRTRRRWGRRRCG
ncbi:U3 snoRNP-associated protein-like EMB2271 [Zea mays]|uniref:U3 snoRNP-associated protein-like EMB2271 n=1 Tax=Zea mays TaxID=4577 RepID=A0A1D6KX57_MAIZE|nr:U3 snoRNP-associated protein-like EMB2271 [Zea mays]